MLQALLLYCEATGIFNSRRIDLASSDSVPVRIICLDKLPHQNSQGAISGLDYHQFSLLLFFANNGYHW